MLKRSFLKSKHVSFSHAWFPRVNIATWLTGQQLRHWSQTETKQSSAWNHPGVKTQLSLSAAFTVCVYIERTATAESAGHKHEADRTSLRQNQEEFESVLKFLVKTLGFERSDKLIQDEPSADYLFQHNFEEISLPDGKLSVIRAEM